MGMRLGGSYETSGAAALVALVRRGSRVLAAAPPPAGSSDHPGFLSVVPGEGPLEPSAAPGGNLAGDAA